jgi:hypothetical protein
MLLPVGKLLLAISSILVSESRGTHDRILLCRSDKLLLVLASRVIFGSES